MSNQRSAIWKPLMLVFALAIGMTATADDKRPLTGKLPVFGYGFLEEKSVDELVKLWSSDNPGLRNASALETARRIWQSKDPVKTLKSLLPRMHIGLKSKNPNERRAVADVVYGLWRAGGKYNVMRVRISDEAKVAGYNAMRKEMGILLPTVCKNIKDDPHLWARAGAVDLAARIIPPYNKPADGLYEKYAKIVRPLLLIRAQDNDKFMQQSAGGALQAIGIDGLAPQDVIKAMTALVDTQVTMTCDVAFKVLGRLEPKDLSSTNKLLKDSLASDVVNRAAMTAAGLLMKTRPPGTAAAVIDFVTRDRHGHGYRAMEYYPIIPKFTDAELRSALPELRRFALMEEVRGRRDLGRARQTVKNLSKLPTLKPAQKAELENAKALIARPSHEWILELFDRLGEPRPEVGEKVTGKSPERTAKITSPPWIPENIDFSYPLPKTDALSGERAMDFLPKAKGKELPIDPRAFSDQEPETSCGYLNVQMSKPEVALRRPLGPTGILGTFSHRRILVMGTQPGSPAHKKILQGDWILGVNSRYFTEEPRIGMGFAIEESEGRKDGAMQLKVLRNSKQMNVTINLQPLGRHVDTYPYGCAKSEKIFDNLCKFIARHDANWVIPGPLLLLASGEDKYIPRVRREVYKFAQEGPVTSNWYTSYRLILMCEYYEKTGDAGILTAIKMFADHLTSGQTYFGGYLHNKSYFNAWKDASKVGYGEMNMAGAPVLVSLIMANECGVALNNTAFRKSIDYFKVFAGRGCVPYGAFPPYIDNPETGGKTCVIGVAFDLLGQREIARPYAAMNGSAYERMWTGYHGGSYWNAAWRPLSVARDTVESFKTLTRYNMWYYNLARHWHGGMTAPVRTGADFGMNHDPGLVMAYGMMYALPRKAIRLTGAPRSVFSKIAELKLEELKRLYDSRDDKALKTHIELMLKMTRQPEETAKAMGALLVATDARRRYEKVEMDQLKAAARDKDFHTAKQMITAMTMAGIKVDDQLQQSLHGVSEDELLKGKSYYDAMRKLKSGPISFDGRELKSLLSLAGGTGFYSAQAKSALEDYGVPEGGKWKLGQLDEIKVVPKETVGRLFFLISPSLDEIRTLRMKSWVTDVGVPHPVDDLKANPDLKNWYTMDYDDTKWPRELGPYLIKEMRGSEREAHVLQRYQFVAKQVNDIDELYFKARLGPRLFRGTFYLNGEAVVEFVESPGPRGRSRGHRRLGQDMAYIKLPAKVKTLMKEGRNVLTVRASLPPNSSWSHPWLRMVDVGLGATKVGGGTFTYDPMVQGE